MLALGSIIHTENSVQQVMASLMQKALTTALATATDLAGGDPDANSSLNANSSKIYVNNITKEESNEDFVKTTISGVFYGGIAT